MTVTTLTDTIYAGNARTLKFTITDEDNGGVLNLTGYTIKWAMARRDTAGEPIVDDVLLEKKSTTPGEVTITDAVNGLVEVKIAEGDTTNDEVGEFYQELEGTDTSSETNVLANGTITVKKNVVNT